MFKKIMGFMFMMLVILCFVGCSNNENKSAKIGRDGVYFYIDDVKTGRTQFTTLYTLHLTSDKSKQKGKFKNEYKDAIGYIVIDDQIRLKNAIELFAGFGCLVSIDGIENLDVSNVKNMHSMFSRCSNLQNLDLSKWDVSNVEDMSQMFDTCTCLLTPGDLSNWNVANVKDMDQMFVRCRFLQTLGDISKWDVSNVESMYGMFAACDSLTNIPNWYKE